MLVAPEDRELVELRWLMSGSPIEDQLPSIDMLLHRPAWMALAGCADEPRETFFGRRDWTLLRRARAICADCPVRSECLDFALADAELVGVWGGASAQERREVRSGELAAAEIADRLEDARHELEPVQRGPHPRCGTLTGYRHHHRLGEPPCGACRQAKAEAHRRERERRLERRAAADDVA